MNCTQPNRRHVVAYGALAAVLPALPARADRLPAEVAGVAIPRSEIAMKAANYARTNMRDFLFNHCMRTFVFGALSIRKLGLIFNVDEAFVAAAFHDLGLLKAFESARGSFEVDGANAAENFVTGERITAEEADKIWHAIVFHDGRWAITKRAGPEAMLVAAGAGADVDGPGDDITKAQIDEVLAAFPRLHFKQHFTQLAVDHCKRKPLSQTGTWLEGLCREQVPRAFTSTTEREIGAAPFAE